MASLKGWDGLCTEVIDAQVKLIVILLFSTVFKLKFKKVLSLKKKIIFFTMIQTGVIIDPARQAIDALGNRSVRLETAVLFRLELVSTHSLPSPRSSNAGEKKYCLQKKKKPWSFRILLVKARQDSPAGVVLRPILSKYGLPLEQTVVCYAGSGEQLHPSTSINRVDQRVLVVMSQQEHNGKKFFYILYEVF